MDSSMIALYGHHRAKLRTRLEHELVAEGDDREASFDMHMLDVGLLVAPKRQRTVWKRERVVDEFQYLGPPTDPCSWAAQLEPQDLEREWRSFYRMLPEEFEELWNIVKSHPAFDASTTRWRDDVVPGRKRLAILLRYLAKGEMFRPLGEAYGLAEVTSHQAPSARKDCLSGASGTASSHP